MTRTYDFDSAGLHRVLNERGISHVLTPTESLVQIIDEENLWRDEDLAQAVQRWKMAAVRRGMRQGLVDEDGVVHECMRVEEVDADTGETKSGYKQLEFFDRGNFEWAYAYRLRRIRSERAEFAKLRRFCKKQLGKAVDRAIQRKLGFMEEEVAPFDEPAEVGG